MAVTGRAADSAIPKISACWAFEYRNSCHIKESLDSNVGAFLHLYNLGVAPTGRAADSAIPKISAKSHQQRCGYLSILSLLVGKYFIAVFRVKKHNKQ